MTRTKAPKAIKAPPHGPDYMQDNRRRSCEVCGTALRRARKHSRFCSTACRMKAYRKRQGQES